MKKIGLQILDWMWDWGWDKEYGGIIYYRDVLNKPCTEYWHDMKFWWPQNETIIAALLAYQMTGDAKYAAMHQQCHDWAYQHFPDREHGGHHANDPAANRSPANHQVDQAADRD